MKDFNFMEFRINVQKDFLDAKRVINTIERYQWEGYYEHDKELTVSRLREILLQLRLKFSFAYEYLGLDRMGIIINKELDEYKNKIEVLKSVPYVDVLYSPVLWVFQNHLNAITCHITSDNEFGNTNSQLLLEQILRGTSKILSDRSIKPQNEAEVRKEIYELLIHVFPDTVREIPIAKVSKSYKPDIGIKSLKCAIEYKYIDSQLDAKTAIGGIFEDIQGYEGSRDWTSFYAVFYMTNCFLTQDQIEAEFKLSKVPYNWKPIVIIGKGERKKNKSA